MESLRSFLAPLTDWMPAELRDKLPLEAWWGIYAAATLLALILVILAFRGLVRALFGGRRQPESVEQEPIEDLARFPPLPPLRPGRRLWVYHAPARVRLVVAAPAGKVADLDATAVEALLDAVLPGLGTTATRDHARIRTWPPQLSRDGFIASFHRRTRKPDPDGQASHWVLVAGKAQVGPKPVLLGLALWTEEPTTLGSLHLDAHQWFDALRMRDER
jgi:hypothetical protein